MYIRKEWTQFVLSYAYKMESKNLYEFEESQSINESRAVRASE